MVAGAEHKPAELPALTNRHSLDTPAKHTRSRSRQQEPVLVTRELSDAPKAAERAATSALHEAVEVATPALGPDSNAASSTEDQSDDDEGASSADSESEEAAPALGLSAAGSDNPSGGEQGSDEDDEDDAASSAESDSEGSDAVGEGVRSAAKPGSAAAPYEEEESSSGWSSEEQGEEEVNVKLAQSMLAALHSMDGGQASGSGAKSDTQRPHVSSGAQRGCIEDFKKKSARR